MNARLTITATCLVLIGVAGYSGYHLGALHTMPATSATQGDRKILYWHDPMVPGQRFDKPGKSPFMDMPLVPVYADGDDAGNGVNKGGVSIDSRIAQNLGIRTAEVKSAHMGAVVEAPGNVAIDERSIRVIQARTTAFVQHVGVRATLDPVRQGQTLVTFYAPDWVAAQEEYLAVMRLPASLQNDLASAAKARMLQLGMTQGQADAVIRTGKLQSAQSIASPLDGLVTEIAVREGMTISPGMTLFRLADLAQVWVIAEVPEAQARSIAPGQTVTVSATAAPDPVQGKVDAILPDVDPATRTIKVRIVLPNKQRRLVPGMFASVRFENGDRQDVLQIPTEAVIRTGQRTLVMVDAGQRGYVSTEIRTGREVDGMTEVISGLRAGQRVVTSGQFLIDSEASLRGTSERLETPVTASAPSAPSTPSTPSTATQEHEATGRIEAVNADSLTISHSAVPSAQWGAMTMDFAAHDAAQLKGLKPGDRIRFRFHLAEDGTAMLSSVQPAGAEGGQR